MLKFLGILSLSGFEVRMSVLRINIDRPPVHFRLTQKNIDLASKVSQPLQKGALQNHRSVGYSSLYVFAVLVE